MIQNFAFTSKYFQGLSMGRNVAFCQFFEEKQIQSSFRFLVLFGLTIGSLGSSFRNGFCLGYLFSHN